MRTNPTGAWILGLLLLAPANAPAEGMTEAEMLQVCQGYAKEDRVPAQRLQDFLAVCVADWKSKSFSSSEEASAFEEWEPALEPAKDLNPEPEPAAAATKKAPVVQPPERPGKP
ncbi:MAG: hypothetical protein HQL57_00580 [Magnetococcales bacterium]|nr:hypothetical protein [Magnetococcales bacterium]MBF0155666.1 hypothetical protein [Magnetococcales bacterium]